MKERNTIKNKSIASKLIDDGIASEGSPMPAETKPCQSC